MAPVRVLKPRVGYTDLCQYPEDGRRYELYDGEVFVVPAPRPIHQIVADNLCGLLRLYAAAHGGLAITSPLDIVFSEYDVVQPDVVFFTAARRYLVQLDEAIRDAPDLVIEVLSPSTAETDRGKKMQMFARYRVPEYWIIDPTRWRVEIHVLVSGGYTLAGEAGDEDVARSGLFAGLELPAAEIFRIP